MPYSRYKLWHMADSKNPLFGDLVSIDSQGGPLETLLRSVLKSVPDAMIVINDTGHILAFSAEAEKLFGYSAASVTGQNVSMLMTGDNKAHHDQYIGNYLTTGRKQIIGVGRIVDACLANGDVIPVELKIGEAEIGGHKLFTGYIRDMSKQQADAHRMAQLQVELANVSRLSTVGTMASAMAHELNQPLTAVANYLEASRDLLEAPDETTLEMVQEALDAAAKQSIRAGQIVRRLRDYVSRGELDLRSVDLIEICEDATSLAKIGIDGVIPQIIIHIDPDCTQVRAERVQLKQVLINLIKNAIEALSDHADPKIWVNAQPDTTHGLVRIRVEDNGPGIVNVEDKTPFDAFHTTKPNGMGLGLSICQTIIDAHGSVIDYAASQHGGAAFSFTLRTVEVDVSG